MILKNPDRILGGSLGGDEYRLVDDGLVSKRAQSIEKCEISQRILQGFKKKTISQRGERTEDPLRILNRNGFGGKSLKMD